MNTEAPLAIEGLSFNTQETNAVGFSFSARNDASKSLVAVMIEWLVVARDAEIPPAAAESVWDSWGGYGKAAGPGQEFWGDKGLEFTVAGPQISQVIGRVAYAEYADGTKLGRESGFMLQRRAGMRSAFATLLSVYESGGASALASAVEQGPPISGDPLAGEIAAYNEAKEILAAHGVEVLVQHLRALS